MADSDRHKLPRRYKSGAQKRKLTDSATKREQETLAKTKKITDLFKAKVTCNVEQQPQTSLSHGVTDKGGQASVHGRPCENETADEVQQLQSHDVGGGDQEQTDGYGSQEGSNYDFDITDIGDWPENLPKDFKEYWLGKDTSCLRHCDATLLEAKSWVQKDGDRHRKCHMGMFERKLQNGERVDRSWLCFSPKTGKVYCSVCKLTSGGKSQIASEEGYCDWKHASSRLQEHETSKDHLTSVSVLARACSSTGRIDTNLLKQLAQQERYWITLLNRLVSVLTFLCERGLPLRGDNETIGSVHNGNYLGILELLSQYDSFLRGHMNKFGNRGRGHTSYLSSTICDELVEILGRRVLDEVIARIQISKYYSISLDSTADEGHVDQLTMIFRYMENETPVERFVSFVPNQGHKAQDMFDGLMGFLSHHGLDIQDCRGQSYDNASAMSGQYNGLQAKVAALNNLAAWIPCAGHSLNLAGKDAAECCPAAVAFFSLLEEIYVFFTASTHRFKTLTDILETAGGRAIVPKRVNTTRWSCRADAVKALYSGFPQYKQALRELAEDDDQTPRARCEAKGLLERMSLLETGVYVIFWHEVLDRTNATSRILQDPQLDMNTAVAAMKSLQAFIEERRECFGMYEATGAELAGTSSYSQPRKRQRNVRLAPLDYGHGEEATHSPSEKFRVDNFLPVIDQFVSSLKYRLSAYEDLAKDFGFLQQLDSLTDDQIREAATKLVRKYNGDLDDSMGIELIQFKEFSRFFDEDTNERQSRYRSQYSLILDKGVKATFPNVETALRMYLVLMVSNCSGERSFSKLKFIKNRLRTTMGANRLNNLAIMSIEYDILRELDFTDVVQDFAQRKARKCVI